MEYEAKEAPKSPDDTEPNFEFESVAIFWYSSSPANLVLGWESGALGALGTLASVAVRLLQLDLAHPTAIRV